MLLIRARPTVSLVEQTESSFGTALSKYGDANLKSNSASGDNSLVYSKRLCSVIATLSDRNFLLPSVD